MRIGWLCEGLYTRNGVCADGGVNHRLPIMAELIKQGHEIVFYSNKYRKYYTDETFKPREDEQIVRDNIILNTDQYLHLSSYVNDFYKEIRDGYFDYNTTEYNFTKIDALVVEPNGMFLGLLTMQTLTNMMKVPTCYIDIDNLYAAFRKGINPDLPITYMMHYPKKGTEQWFFPYNEEDELPIVDPQSKEYGLMYIGNDYKRKDKMIKYYNISNANILIYGKYKQEMQDEFNCTVKFGGKLPFEFVMSEYAKAKACVNIIRKDYEKLGNFTYRTVELAQGGVYQFVDKDIIGWDRFFDCKDVVSSAQEVIDKLPTITIDDVIRQRNKIKKFVPSVLEYTERVLKCFN